MKKYQIAICIVSAFLFGCVGSNSAETSRVGDSKVVAAERGYDVAAYVWPAYQPEPRWKELGIFGDGKGEWQNVYEARPKYAGDSQPKVPLWGYENEADPIAVSRKIDAALAAGVNVFIYDWYWYEGKPFLENALNEGFLKAPNNERMGFFIMWANHDVTPLWNNKTAKKNEKIFWYANVSYDEFTKVLVPRFVEYFKKPNYYKIDGKPVFSVYNVKNLIRGMGGVQKAKEAFDFLDSAAKNAGLKGVSFMAICPISAYGFGKSNELPHKKNATPTEVAEYLGFSSFTTYNWVSESWNAMYTAKPQLTYDKWVDINAAKFGRIQERFPSAQYFPHVSTGWDTNPRYPADSYQPSILKSNPADFERGLRAAKAWLDANRRADMPSLITVNAWNEWTEGCCLEPSKEFGYGFLNAVSRVFRVGH